MTADKGVALFVIDKDDYIKKAEDLLKENTYKKIAEDPTPKQKNKLISILRNIKAEGGLKDEVYRRLYPTGAGSPKFYGLPKIHKSGIPLMLPLVTYTKILPIVLPTCRPTSEPTYCPVVGQHVS